MVKHHDTEVWMLTRAATCGAVSLPLLLWPGPAGALAPGRGFCRWELSHLQHALASLPKKALSCCFLLKKNLM